MNWWRCVRVSSKEHKFQRRNALNFKPLACKDSYLKPFQSSVRLYRTRLLISTENQWTGFSIIATLDWKGLGYCIIWHILLKVSAFACNMIFIVQYFCKHTDKKFWKASVLIYLLFISIWNFYICIIGFGFEKVIFYHDENLTIDFNFWNHLMFFLGLPLFH